jgi:hypothetical protein
MYKVKGGAAVQGTSGWELSGRRISIALGLVLLVAGLL